MKVIVSSVIVCMMFTLTLCGQENKTEYENSIRLLIFSKTEGFRHESISAGIKMLYDYSASQKWILTASEDPSVFNDTFLRNIDVVVFLNPSGDVLSDAEQASFEQFMNSGKGMVGIHAAADFEYEWPFYGKLMGAWFKNHPPSQEATVLFENHDHPAMAPFKGMESYTTFDEWYTFRNNPRPNVNVLATLDESTIMKSDNEDWKMGDHPLIWWQEIDGMRSFYTGFGHTPEAYQDDKIAEHIKNAINWAARRVD